MRCMPAYFFAVRFPAALADERCSDPRSQSTVTATWRMSDIYLMLANESDRQSIVNALASRYSIQSIRSLASLRVSPHARPIAIVYEAGYEPRNHDVLVGFLERHSARLVVRSTIDVASVREVLALARRVRDLGVSVRGCSDATDLGASLLEPDNGPTGWVLDQISSHFSADAACYIGAALCISRSRVSVADYAKAVGQAVRTLQQSHRSVGLPSPHRTLVWCQAIWASWRLQRWGLTCKQAAQRGGFSASSAMGTALSRIVGLPPSRFARNGGVTALTERFAHDAARHQCVPPNRPRRIALGTTGNVAIGRSMT